VDAIVLAGGLGKRLRSAVSDLPKPMAPVNGRPFLSYLLDYLNEGPVTRCVLATGHLHEKIATHYGGHYKDLEIVYSEEIEPLGTGGGLKQAFQQAAGREVFVLNGDTFFDVDLLKLSQVHSEHGADLTIALKPMVDISRYGVVKVEASRVKCFEEKKEAAEGFINGGVYLTRRSLFEGFDLPEKFSFEEIFLKQVVTKINVQAYFSDTYFIDIGIPEDYERAQRELPRHE